MAIHDAAYATPPRTFLELRYRMRHLFEERVGRRISEERLREQAREQAAWDRMRQVVG